MNDSINNYWSRSEAAQEFGISVPTLKKHEVIAEANGYGLGENFVQKGNIKLWHKDEWYKIQSGRLQKYIDEAVMLGLVVPIKQSNDELVAEYQRGYDTGFKAGVDSVASELPVDPDSEVAETLGYTSGGFAPLSALGL